MTVAEAARLLEVTPRAVYDLCKYGHLGHQRIGVRRGVIRITEADVAAYIASRRIEPHAPAPDVRTAGTGLAIRSITGEMLAEEERKAGPARRRRSGGPS